jgi:hypothetical protein
MITMPKITAESFDALVRPSLVKSDERIIWGAGAIAKKLRVSADFVRDRLARIEGSPIKKIGGRYCAIEADLIAWFRA